MAKTDSNWSSIEDEIASLLPEIRREDLANEIPGDPALLSDVPSIASRAIRAVLLILGATLVITIVSPYLAWIAASVTR